MLTVVSDTHGKTDHRLTGRTMDVVQEADIVLHAGDFTTREVLEGFEREAARVEAVYGNNDSAGVRRRVPRTRVVDLADYGGIDAELRIAMAHGHAHDETSLSLFGREAGASLVVSGHSHRPAVTDAGEVTLLNPGSHADPRWYRPAHAELDAEVADGLRGRLVDPDGTVFEEFRVRSTDERR